MPKVRLCVDPLEKRLTEKLRKLYKGMMELSDICMETGYERKAAEKWASDLPKFHMNGNKVKYLTEDVAAKLARSVAE